MVVLCGPLRLACNLEWVGGSTLPSSACNLEWVGGSTLPSSACNLKWVGVSTLRSFELLCGSLCLAVELPSSRTP